MSLGIFSFLFVLVYSGSSAVFDQNFFQLLNDSTSNVFVGTTALFLTQFGTELVLAVIGVVYYIVARSDRMELLLGVFLMLALSDLVLAVLKGGYYRPRPYLSLANVNLPAGTDSGSSFPSGHATRAFAAATLFTLRRGKAYALLLPVALGVAASRVLIGVHYPTDAIAGAFLGVSIASAVLLFLGWTVYPRLESTGKSGSKSSEA